MVNRCHGIPLRLSLFPLPHSLRTLVKEVKNRDWYRDARRQYFKHSAAGWVLFFVPVVIVSLLWHKGHLSPVTPQDAVLLLVGILFYFLSLILHLYAFSSAALSTLKQHINKDRF